MSDLGWELTSEGILFSLQRRKLFSRESISIADWAASASKEILPSVVLLLAWLEEGHAEERGNGILVDHARVAGLDVVQAQSLLLPPICPFVLDIQHHGTFDAENFSFRLSWLQPNGQPVPGLRRTGAILESGSGPFRIAEPMYSISEGVAAFNSVPEADIDGRFRAWAKIKALLPDDAGRSVSIGGYLASTRIAHASSFSLALRSGSDGFNFDPVLFGDQTRPDEQHGDNTWTHEAEGLLPPAQQTIFASRRFRESMECRARYALGSGWYVVLDEPVRLALGVVRQAQEADKETRKSFVRNPRAFLQKALGAKLPEKILEQLFIETAEYSDRVKDVGIWQPKVLPWVKRSNDPWLPERFGIRIDGENIEIDAADLPAIIRAIEAAIENGEATISQRGKEIPANAGSFAALMALMGQVEPSSGPDRGSTEETPDADRSNTQYVLEIEDNLSEPAYQRLRRIRSARLTPSTPVCIATALKVHQQEGLRWLQEAFIGGHPGVLLADDMGLGKTLQALCFLAWLKEEMEAKRLRKEPILIVAPTGLLKNWEQEHSRHLHSPGLGSLLRVYGSNMAQLRASETKGQDTRIGAATLDTRKIGEADWILTTYEALRDYQHSFCSLRYAAVVFDEMQKIKTPGTVMTHAAKALNSEFILGLTGTPVENRLADLWCLIDTLQPGLLRDLSDFSRTYEREENPQRLRELKSLLTERQRSAPAIMMRRMKTDRLQGLPEKIEHPLRVGMPPEQSEAYERAIAIARGQGGGSKILEALHQLRSISLHPYHPSQAKDDSYALHSARVRVSLEVLDEIAAKGEKALIFLESQEFQPYLAGLIQRRYKMKVLPMLINGTVSGPKRQERVNAFQQSGKGFDVIILSPRAGGVGLTLTAANHVIHLSRWWNPAVEDQCTDRVYRIGQEKTVHVYFPQAVHPIFADQSFDLKLHRLLENKRALSRDLLMPPVSPDDATKLYNETVAAEPEAAFSIHNIDSMEPIQFEDWVLHRLVEAGHQVNRTKKTGDYGADGIAYHRLTKRPYIIQCKHTQSGSSPDAAISDLLRAKDAYMVTDPKLVAVTNAGSFGASARSLAKQHDMILVDRSSLLRWPHLID